MKEADGSLKDYWVMKKEDPDSPESLYTIGNLQVNPALTKELPSLDSVWQTVPRIRRPQML